jgi:alkyldihydroxyacetonephosphate synthase
LILKKKKFVPAWSDEAPPAGSYRSVFKLGAPHRFKHPSDAWYEMLKEQLGMNDEDFQHKHHEGRRPVAVKQKPRLSTVQIQRFMEIVGRENVAVDDFSRVRFSYGKTVEETLELRYGHVRHVADAVVHPRNKHDVRRIIGYCHEQKIPVYGYGGGSSVTLGIRPVHGGIVLVLSTHMNRVLAVNEKNQTVRVQPGCMGPAYEEALNNAAARFGTRFNYTGGHFPQSFEMSTVGGWVVTLGAGQASTYYGDVYDLVVSQEYVTPAGTFTTPDFPATAMGPRVNDIMKGSEGAFGILVEVTLKIFRHLPQNRRCFAFMFADWQAAADAGREISQGQFGLPAVFRISDPDETEIGLKLYRFNDTILDRAISWMGYKPGRRCLCLATAEGQRAFARNVKTQIRKICRQHGALPLTGIPVRRWEKTRYSEPLMRDDLQDYGIIIDTLETAVTWDNFHRLHEGVSSYIKTRPHTICMAHASHFYPQGTNLYFIFILHADDLQEYQQFQRVIFDKILQYGGSLSHHHGIGKMMAPWLEKQLGREQMAVLQALKRHFDPHNIMNPGALLVPDATPANEKPLNG